MISIWENPKAGDNHCSSSLIANKRGTEILKDIASNVFAMEHSILSVFLTLQVCHVTATPSIHQSVHRMDILTGILVWQGETLTISSFYMKNTFTISHQLPFLRPVK